jgi:hypothetical protein
VGRRKDEFLLLGSGSAGRGREYLSSYLIGIFQDRSQNGQHVLIHLT